MSTSISPPLSESASGSAFDVMDKTGCNDLTSIRSQFELRRTVCSWIWMHSRTRLNSQRCIKRLEKSVQIKASSTHPDIQSSIAPLPPRLGYCWDGMKGCSGVHAAGTSKGKQDTAGQTRPPSQLRRTETRILHEAFLAATVYSTCFQSGKLKCWKGNI